MGNFNGGDGCRMIKRRALVCYTEPGCPYSCDVCMLIFLSSGTLLQTVIITSSDKRVSADKLGEPTSNLACV